MMISSVRGHFEKFGGTVDFDEEHPARSNVDVKIDAASINTNEPQRDAHLKSPDFLDAERYPYLYFKSRRIEMRDPSHGLIIGDLTIRDVTREVALEVQYAGQAKSPMGTISAGFNANTEINRKDWGVNWNVFLETGGVLVADQVNISMEIEPIKQPVPVA